LVTVSDEKAPKLLQTIYREPVRDNLIERRVRGSRRAVFRRGLVYSADANRFGDIAQNAGVDIFVRTNRR
jgi:IMP dehydrogenase